MGSQTTIEEIEIGRDRGTYGVIVIGALNFLTYVYSTSIYSSRRDFLGMQTE